MINELIQVMKKAGKEVMQVYSTDFKAEDKDGSPITEADRKSNDILIKELTQFRFPILSEESEDDSARLKSDKVFIIDPLDGTADFVNRTGEFSIMLGLVENNVPILGIVYVPLLDVTYYAEKGKGAYKIENGVITEIKCSNVELLENSRAIVSRHHFSDEDKNFFQQLGIKEFKPKGSAGLKISDIAEGKGELYLTSTNKIKQWDTCAAYCIIKEAGGEMTDVKGNSLVYNTENVYHENGILVSNGQCHNEIVQKFKDFLN